MRRVMLEVRRDCGHRTPRARRSTSTSCLEVRRASCSRTMSRLNGDDGSMEPEQCDFRTRGIGCLRRGAQLRGRSPLSDGGFLLGPGRGTIVEQLSGDELLFADGVSRKQPFLCFVTAPAPFLGLRIQGRSDRRRHVPAPSPRSSAAPPSYCRSMTGRVRLLAPAASPLAEEIERLARDPALVRPQRARPLPRPARPRTVFRRRLGHPRRDARDRWRLLLALGCCGADARHAGAGVPQPEPRW